jgi:DNA polymerase I
MGTSMKYVAVDIETTGLSFKKDRILGIGIGDQYYTDLNHVPQSPATAHNGRFEYKFMKENNLPWYWAFDTLLAASVLIDRPADLDLASVAQHYLGMESWKSDTDKLFKKKNWVQLLEQDPKLQEALAARNIYDLKATSQLTEVLLHRLEKEGMTKFFFEKLMPAARLLADVEYRGMRINLDATKMKLADIEQQISFLLVRLSEWSAPQEINWNSPIQVKKFLRDKGYDLWIYDFKKREMVESTGAESLERLLPNTNIQMLLDYKEALKLKGFLQGWLDDQVDGRLYPSYNIANTRTGRLSCSAPNLQQVPRDKSVRSLFIPSDNKVFVIADFAQIEPRIAAHYTQDEALTEVFTDGLDFYGSIAVNVLGVKCAPNEVKENFPDARKVAKEIGLSILYGIGAAKLATIIKKRSGIIFTKEEAAKIIKDYFAAYPKLEQFRKYVINKIDHGEILKTYYGRQFRLDPEKAFSTGVNTIVQSTASDACLFSQLDVKETLEFHKIDAKLTAIVHDEVIYECDAKDAETVGNILSVIMTSQGFNCPTKLDWVIGNNWGDKA